MMIDNRERFYMTKQVLIFLWFKLCDLVSWITSGFILYDKNIMSIEAKVRSPCLLEAPKRYNPEQFTNQVSEWVSNDYI